jgi:hypothetical protein
MYTDQDIANLVARVQQLEQQLASRPIQGQSQFGITSRNFLTRAFSVWGLNFVAQLLISIGISCILVVISLILGASLVDLFGRVAQNFPQF